MEVSADEMRNYAIGAAWGIVSILGYSYMLGGGGSASVYQMAMAGQIVMFTLFAPKTLSVIALEALQKATTIPLSGIMPLLLIAVPPMLGILFFLLFVRLLEAPRRSRVV